MRQIFRDPVMQAEYDPLGYHSFDLLNDAEIQGLLEGLTHLTPDDGFSPVHRDGRGLTYHCSFLDTNIDYRRRVHELISRFFGPHIERVLNDYRILNANFYVKPPGSGVFEVHQNWPAISDIEDTTVTMWCPLIDVVEENGALNVVPGSHKILPHVESANSPGYFTDFKDAMVSRYLKPIPMKAGQAIVFDDGLIHWSANNDSDIPRIAIQILCIPKDSTPVYWFLDKKQPERFELIAADTEFWLTTGVKDMMQRQPDWTSLGYAENRNRTITEEEFAQLLQDGDRIRQELSSKWKRTRE